MPQETQTTSHLRHIVAAALCAIGAWLAFPAVAWGESAFSPLAISSQICATGNLQQLAPHLAALVATLVLVAITLRGDISLCLEYFPITEAFTRTWPPSRHRRSH